MKSKILFIAATHGDEAFSIPVLQELEKEYPKSEYSYDWIIGNARAIEHNVRFIDTDLNRSAPGNIQSNSYEEKRAAEIIEISQRYDIVIDIHGTKSDFGIIKILPYPSYPNLVLASLFREPRNVIWRSKQSKDRGPLVQFMHCPAIELECGDKTDPKTQKLLKETLIKFLHAANTQYSIRKHTSNQEFYIVYDLESKDKTPRKDFQEIKIGKEIFHPFLAKNGYTDISYYKMRKITIEELFSERN
jgi:predicted deacylase